MEKVSSTTVHEVVRRYRTAYEKANRRGKSAILTELERVTGYHRKSLIRLLSQDPNTTPAKRSGRPPKYQAVLPQLRKLWATGLHACGTRIIGELDRYLDSAIKRDDVTVTPYQEMLLRSISPATIDRILAQDRKKLPPLRHNAPKPSSLLRSRVPMRTFADWHERTPGFFEVDLVAHCGETTCGEYLFTLTITDVFTGWTVLTAMKGRGQHGTLAALREAFLQVPFPVRGIDCDNDTAFINAHLCRYCEQEGIKLTRSRPYKKNDQCYVEQKNWSCVRQLVGYRRLETDGQLAILKRLYPLVNQYHNLFRPMMRLVSKERHGAKVKRKYDKARTPYKRLLEVQGCLSDQAKTKLEADYRELDPAALLESIQTLLRALDRSSSGRGSAAGESGLSLSGPE